MSGNALSQYFPFLEKPNDGNADALRSTFAIASVGITMLTMLETLLPAAAAEVERESRVMADHFFTIADYAETQKSIPVPVQEAIAGIVVGMQFQDRNTQIMDNVAGMIERYRSMLEEVCGNIDAQRGNSGASCHTITQAIDDILSSIRLSDIRTRYLEALAKAKVSGIETLAEAAASEIDDIELF